MSRLKRFTLVTSLLCLFGAPSVGTRVCAQTTQPPPPKPILQVCPEIPIAITGQPEIIRHECMAQNGDSCVALIVITAQGVSTAQTCVSMVSNTVPPSR
jgi:hypothetical protein